MNRLFLIGCAAFAGCGPAVVAVNEVASSNAAAVREASPIVVAEDDWPWWRGRGRDGHAVGDAPVEWSADKNIVWKAEVPGRGHASPIVWEDKVFISTADEGMQQQLLLAYDRDSGDKLWQCEIHAGGFDSTHSKNSQASATPACDGEHVYCVFLNGGNVQVTAVDFNGEKKWQESAGRFSSQRGHGHGASPVLFKSLVIVVGDNAGGAFIAALDKSTGDIAWRKSRPNADSFGTPILANINGNPQLLHSGQQTVISYDPATGEENWRCAGPAESTANTMTAAGNLVFASGGYPQQNIYAIRADGSGEIVWQTSVKVYVPSLLVADGRLFAIGDGGIAMAFEAATGKELWKKRLGGDVSASPVIAGENVYVPNERGKMFVFGASDKYELIAENELTSGGMSTPAICGGRIYLRTDKQLYCIGG